MLYLDMSFGHITWLLFLSTFLKLSLSNSLHELIHLSELLIFATIKKHHFRLVDTGAYHSSCLSSQGPCALLSRSHPLKSGHTSAIPSKIRSGEALASSDDS